MSPHATETTTNGNMSQQPLTNGDKAHSQFLSHLTSIPLISDSISVYSQHPYGAKTISLFNSAYSTVHVKIYQPVSPYLSGPYSIVAPYLAKADSLGDSGLSSIESRFPIVKADTATIQEKVQTAAGTPFKLASDGKNYVFKTYDDEYKKSQGSGIVKSAKAAIGTNLKLTAVVLQTVADYFSKAKQQGKEVIEKNKTTTT